MICYMFGGDEFVFVEISEVMLFDVFFKGMVIMYELQWCVVLGIIEICLVNVFYQVCYDLDVIEFDMFVVLFKVIEVEVGDVLFEFDICIVEVLVLYNDLWMYEMLMWFCECYQDLLLIDFEYVVWINGKCDVDDFIVVYLGLLWFVLMVGFVVGLLFMYQMVECVWQFEVLKYLWLCIDMLKLMVGYGGCFGCIYLVCGVGGYQMFGVMLVLIFDFVQWFDYLCDFMVFFWFGDIVKFQLIDCDVYDVVVVVVEVGIFLLCVCFVKFLFDVFWCDFDVVNCFFVEVLYVC